MRNIVANGEEIERNARLLMLDRILWRSTLGFSMTVLGASGIKPIFNSGNFELPAMIKTLLVISDVWSGWWFVCIPAGLVMFRLCEDLVLKKLPVPVLRKISWVAAVAMPSLLLLAFRSLIGPCVPSVG